MSPELLNSFGLFLDMIGIILIWKYGMVRGALPVKNSDGKEFMMPLGSETTRGLFKRLDAVGFMCVIVGFFLQIISNYIPGSATMSVIFPLMIPGF